jgi:hypothetical protein
MISVNVFRDAGGKKALARVFKRNYHPYTKA